MTTLKEHIKKIINVISVIECFDDAKNFVDCYLMARPEINRTEILTELEKLDNRFIGWNSIKIIDYSFSDVTGNTLYLKKHVANEIVSNRYKIKVILYEEEV